MISHNFLLSLLPLVQLADADHLEPQQAFNPFHSCSDCFRSSWKQGPECRTNTILLSTISRILNPPAAATPTYAPSQWCSEYLRQTDLVTFRANITAISTSTNVEFYQPLVTETDLTRPTLTALCPVPSVGMECGWDTNFISPIEQGLDESVLNDGVVSAEDCHQACLLRPACKAYRWDGRIGNPCAIFNVGIGPNAAHLIKPTPGGTQWYDRNCPVDLPAGCTLGWYPYSNATAVPHPSIASAAPLGLPIITPAPDATPGVIASVPSSPVEPPVAEQGLPPLEAIPNPQTLLPPVVPNSPDVLSPVVPNPQTLLPPVVPNSPDVLSPVVPNSPDVLSPVVPNSPDVLPPVVPSLPTLPIPPGLASPPEAPLQPDLPGLPIEPNQPSPPGPPNLPNPPSPPIQPNIPKQPLVRRQARPAVAGPQRSPVPPNPSPLNVQKSKPPAVPKLPLPFLTKLPPSFLTKLPPSFQTKLPPSFLTKLPSPFLPRPILSKPKTPTAKGSNSPVAKGSSPPVAKGSNPPTVKNSNSAVAKGSNTPTAKGSKTPVAKGSDLPIAKGSNPPTAKGSNPPVAKGQLPLPPLTNGSIPSVAKSTLPPFAKDSKPPVAKGPFPLPPFANDSIPLVAKGSRPPVVKASNSLVAKSSNSRGRPKPPSSISAPSVPPRPTPHVLAKRNIPFPPYFADLNYIWSSVYVTPACSCIISSALPPVPSSTTSTITRHNATVIVTTTTVDPFTVTITPREVTIYVSVS